MPKARRTEGTSELVLLGVVRFLFICLGAFAVFLGTVMILPEGTPMGYCFTVVGFFVLGVILLAVGGKGIWN